MDKSSLDILWIIMAAGLVFVMQMGFLCLEAGMTRSKNAIHVAIKNITDFGITMILFWAVGFGIMFGITQGGWFGFTHFFTLVLEGKPWLSAFFLYQVMFCGTAVTIISGAVAERIRFWAYCLMTVLISTLIYPVFGHWAWGGVFQGAPGWLAGLGFIDFAGATVVHSVGGWAALAVLLIVGPRAGRFPKNKPPQEIPGNNLPMAMLGVLLLWFGWIGFNGGSTLEMNQSVPGIIIKTMLAGGAGMLSALSIGWFLYGYPSARLVMNGSLAGLVAITANCFAVDAVFSILIGAIGGLVMLLAERLLERWHIDDVVGAVPVHLVAGIWGTLAVALFGNLEVLDTGLNRLEQLQIQILGIVVCGVYTFGMTYLIMKLIHRKKSLRVSFEQEKLGLNVAEHRATTETLDLLSVMEQQAKTQNLGLRVPVEPFTEIGQIASRYNHVISALEDAVIKTKSIVATATDAIITFTKESFKINFVNPSAEKIFGYLDRPMLNQPIFALIEGENVENKDSFARIFPQLERGKPQEMVGKRADGTNFPMEVIITEAKVGGETFYIGTFRDIEEKKDAAEKQKVLEFELNHAQKMEGIGRLAGGVAHDFNNQLTAIIGYSEILLDQLNEGEPRYSELNEILQAAYRSSELTKQLLLFSRREVVAVENILVDELVEQFKKMLGRIMREDIELIFFQKAEAGIIKMDSTQVENILTNLCVNAQDSMLKGGKLIIETRNFTFDEAYIERHIGVEAGDYVMISVTDSGDGIPEDVRPHIFEPFFTTKEKGKGTGLGLATIYSIVKQNEGYIDVYSEIGHGTVFKIFLPRVKEKEELVTKPVETGKLVGGNETVLLVEDDGSVCKLALAMLKKQGYKVITAANGEEALTIAKQQKKIDLLLTDIIMPKMGGHELAEKMEAFFPNIKTIFSSGYTDDVIFEKGVLKPDTNFIQKPYRAFSLISQVRAVLDQEDKKVA